MFLENFFRFMGSLVCHQIPERTLIIDNIPLPACARDTGIYIGVISGIIFLTARKRFHADWPPKVKHALLLILMMFPMIIDGTTSYIGLRYSDNLTRLMTGGFFGFPLAIFFTVARNYHPDNNSKIPPFSCLKELLIPLFFMILLLYFIYKGIILWFFVSLLLISGLLAMFYMIADSVVSIFEFQSKIKKKLVSIVGIFCILGCLYLFSRYFLGAVNLSIPLAFLKSVCIIP
ncbi:MAG: DUF2085 domain-containing protein [Ignavibacteriales bacterium]